MGTASPEGSPPARRDRPRLEGRRPNGDQEPGAAGGGYPALRQDVPRRARPTLLRPPDPSRDRREREDDEPARPERREGGRARGRGRGDRRGLPLALLAERDRRPEADRRPHREREALPRSRRSLRPERADGPDDADDPPRDRAADLGLAPRRLPSERSGRGEEERRPPSG